MLVDSFFTCYFDTLAYLHELDGTCLLFGLLLLESESESESERASV